MTEHEMTPVPAGTGVVLFFIPSLAGAKQLYPYSISAQKDTPGVAGGVLFMCPAAPMGPPGQQPQPQPLLFWVLPQPQPLPPQNRHRMMMAMMIQQPQPPKQEF